MPTELLELLKTSLGDLDKSDTALDAYYNEKLTLAYADLSSDDISEARLNTDLGKAAIVLYAKLLVNDVEVSTNPSLNTLRQKLAILTRGDEVEDVEQ